MQGTSAPLLVHDSVPASQLASASCRRRPAALAGVVAVAAAAAGAAAAAVVLTRPAVVPAPPVTPAYVPAQLNDTATCAALGFADVTPFMRRLAVPSPYNKTSSAPLFLPVFSSHALAGDVAPAVTTAVIFIHGLSGAANSYFCTGSAASAGRNALVLAPWFGDEQVDSASWGGGDAPGAAYSTYWTTSRWMSGGNISPGATAAAQYTTAFDVVDALIRNVTTSGAFPSLRRVALVGFSAGAQYSLRYAFASPAGADPSASGGVPVLFIVSDPGDYLYLNASRPGVGCRPLIDSGAAPSPCADWPVPDAAGCPGYDEYKYGLSDMGYLNAYLAPLDADPAAKAAAVSRFATKRVAYVLGGADACNCNTPGFTNGGACFPVGGTLDCAPNAAGSPGCCDTWPDAATDNALDVSCAAGLQGSNRLQRGLLYAQHLRAVFPAAPPEVSVVPGMAHNNSALYASAAFVAAVFE